MKIDLSPVNIGFKPLTAEELIKQISDFTPKKKCLMGYLGTNGEHFAHGADYPLKRIKER